VSSASGIGVTSINRRRTIVLSGVGIVTLYAKVGFGGQSSSVTLIAVSAVARSKIYGPRIIRFPSGRSLKATRPHTTRFTGSRFATSAIDG
jgi:hypothetical protein